MLIYYLIFLGFCKDSLSSYPQDLFPAIREYYNNIIIILGLYEWYKRNKYNKNMNKPNINNENNIIWRLLRRNY